MRATFLLLLMLFLPFSGAGADADAYENELVGRLTQTLAPAEFVWLQADGASFAGLYRPSAGAVGRAIVLLHGMGAHADWPGIISPLRTRLPEHGWSTLSIQLPVLPPQQSLSDYGTVLNRSGSRIRAAIRYLQQAGYTDIVLVGYSFGATVAVNYLAGNNTGIRAFAGISMQEFPFLDPPLKLIDQLARVKMPVLDIYAARDFSDVLRSVDDRRLAASRAANNAYQQLAVRNTDHYFSGHQQQLVEQVVVWLDTTVPVEAAVSDTYAMRTLWSNNPTIP